MTRESNAIEVLGRASLLIVLTGVILGGQAVAAETLFGSAKAGGSGSPSTLYQIDPSSGAAVAVGPIGFNNVGAMDFDPISGVLYGAGSRVADGVWVLITIDPLSGAGVEVGPFVNTQPSSGGHFDMSYRSDGSLFLTAFGASCVSLFSVNTGTGLATELGGGAGTGTCAPGNGLAYDAGDALFQDDIATVLGGSGTLYSVDDVTGFSTPISPLTYLGFPALSNPRINAMDFQPSTGVAYASVNDGSGGSGPNYLATLDTTTGDVTHIGLSVNALDALAWDVAGAPPVPGVSGIGLTVLILLILGTMIVMYKKHRLPGMTDGTGVPQDLRAQRR